MTATSPIVVAAATAAESSAANTERVAVVLGLFTLLGTLITGTFSYLSNRNARAAKTHAAEANDAVNHRHPDQPRMFDTVNHLQSQLNLVQRSVMDLSDTHQHQHQEVMSEVSDVRKELRDHVEWEMREKYPWDGTERRKTQLPYPGDNRRINPEENP